VPAGFSLLLLMVLGLAVVFDYINGFHDTANAIATSVSTRALRPQWAILMSATANFLGALTGTAVAKTIASGIATTPTGDAGQIVVASALIGGIVWNLLTWRLGIPSSSSHALIGGLIGAVIAASGPVVSLVGDAAFMMTGSEVAVAVNAGLRGPTWIVLDNGGNGMCQAGFKLGCDSRAPSSLFDRPADIAGLARAYGAVAFSVDSADTLASTVRVALATGRPAVVRIPVDPEAVPPMGGRLEALTFVSGRGEENQT